MALPDGHTESIDWAALAAGLDGYLRGQLGSAASDDDIEDLRQQVLLRLLDPRTLCWCPELGPIFEFACGVAWGLVRNRRRREARRRRHLQSKLASERVPDATALDEALERRRVLARLVSLTEHDKDLQAILAARLKGHERYPDCEFLGLSKQAFESARRRLWQRVATVRRDLGESP